MTTHHSNNPTNVSDYLRDILNTNMNVEEVDLQFRTIQDILPYLNFLAHMKRLKKLSLHGNRLKQLPADLSMLANLEYLDISNNLFQDNIQLTVGSLKTLPKLRYLKFDIPQQKGQKIAKEIKTLQFFNNKKIQRQVAKKEFVFELVNRKTMDDYENKMAQMYRQLLEYQQKYLNQTPQQDAVDRFKQDIKVISKDSLQKLARTSDKASHTLEYITLYMTRYEMFDQLKTKALNLCQDIYSDLGDFIYKISQEQDDLFKSLAEKSLNLTQVEYEMKEQEQEQKEMKSGTADYMVLNKNMVMQKEIKRLKKQKEQLITEMSQIDNLNRKMTEALSKYSKSQRAIGNYKDSKTTRLDFDGHSHSGNRGLPLPTLRTADKASGIKAPKQIHHHHYPIQNNYSTGGRNLTIKQLKDIIDEIYDSKLKFDQKNYDGKIARQTMHQYLFTYLNQKYGLKNLTIQAAASIVSGIQAYSSEDNDICVFGKILRNQIDQQFRFVQTQLKTTVNDLLKMHIKTKMPYKSATQINDMLNGKVSHEISWEEAEDIVKYLYNKQDAESIIRKLDVLFKINEKSRDDRNNSRRLTRQEQAALQSQRHVRKIKFSLFLKCVLDFQLRNHQRLLKPLVRVFKMRDTDSDGVVNEEEFIYIIQQLCLEANEIIPYLLNIVDPYQTKQITFTQMVRLVANYPESSPILSRFVTKEEQDNYLSEQNQEYSYNQ